MKAQALLTLRLASTLGFRRVVLAGHSDGALVALLAASVACRQAAPGTPLSRSSSQAIDIGALAGSTAAEAGQLHLAPGASSAVPVAARPAGHRRRGSLPESLDWAWMSSQHEGRSVLERLLRGEWPASIEPGAAGLGSLGAAGARPPVGRRSPLRNRQAARQGVGGELLQPFLEQEERGELQASGSALLQRPGSATAVSSALTNGLQPRQLGPSGGASASTEPSERLWDNPSYLSGSSSARSSLEQPGGGGALPQEASTAAPTVIENPSFLSEVSGCPAEQPFSFPQRGGHLCICFAVL